MSTDVGTAYVTLLPSARGFQAAAEKQLAGVGHGLSKKMGDEIDDSTKSGGSLFRSFAGIATAAVGVFAGVKVFKGFIDEATEAQVTSAKTAAVLKSTGGAAKVSAGDIGNLANALSRKGAVDDEVIQSGANVLLTFTKVRNEAGKGNDIFNQGTSIALDMSKALGTDLQGSVIQVGKALNDPIKGVSALQRVGVSFTAQQKDQIKTLVKSGDTLGAQKLILGELNTEFGGAAEASATTGDKLRVVWGNVQEQLGGLLLPVLNKVGDWLSNVLPKAADFATGAFRAIGGVVSDLVSYFTAGFTGMGTNEGSGIFLFFNRLGMFAADAWDVISTVVPKIIGTVKGVIDDVIAGFNFEDTSNNIFGRIGDNARAAWDVISTVVPQIKDAIITALGAVVSWVKDHWTQIKDVFAGVYDAIANTVKFVVDHKPVLIGVLTAIGGAFVVQGALATAAAVASAAAWLVAAAIPIAIGVAVAALVAGLIYAYQKVDWFRAAVDAVAKAVVAAFHWVRDNYQQIGVDIWHVMYNIGSTTADVFGHVVDVVQTTVEVVTKIVDGFIAGIMFLWRNWGDEVVATVKAAWNFVSGVVQAAMDIVHGIITTVTALIHGDWSGAWDGIAQVFNGVWEYIKTVVTTALEAVRITISTAVSSLKVVWSPVVDLVSYFVDRVAGPIGSAVGAMRDTVKGAIQGAVDGAKAAWSGLSAIYNFFVQNVQTPIESAIGRFGDGMRTAFDTAVHAVGLVWDGLKRIVGEPINIVIGFYNKGIAGLWNFIASKVGLPPLGTIDPLKFATGGMVPGSGRGDKVPILAEPGEGILTVDAVKRLGGNAAIVALNDPKSSIDPGVLGYAGGGVVKSADETQAWARQQAGKPYVFAAVGPNAFDCSGFTSALINFVLGLVPWTRRHSSGTVGLDPALRPGDGGPRGLTIGALPPYTFNHLGDFVGHTTASIADLNAEATPPAVRVGGNARGAGALPQQYNLPGFGGPNADEQGMIDVLKSLLHLQIPGLGGSGFADMLKQLIVSVPKTIYDFLITKVPQIVKDAIINVGISAGAPNPAGAVVGVLRDVLPFLANGGRIRRDGPILVGERGPEIRWGSRGDYVEANASVAGGTGQVRDVHFHYDVAPTATQIATGIRMAQLGA